MKLRCPYCKQIFTEPQARCPHCDHAMKLPAALRPTTFQQRQRMRVKLERDAEKKMRRVHVAEFKPGRNPRFLFGAIFILTVTGVLLVSKLGQSNLPERTVRPNHERAAKELANIRIAVEHFREDVGRYPSHDEGLKALVLNPGITNWNGYYITLLKPDPWRSDYQYRVSTNEVVVFSRGRDRIEATEDDITAPTPTAEECVREAWAD